MHDDPFADSLHDDSMAADPMGVAAFDDNGDHHWGVTGDTDLPEEPPADSQYHDSWAFQTEHDHHDLDHQGHPDSDPHQHHEPDQGHDLDHHEHPASAEADTAAHAEAAAQPPEEHPHHPEHPEDHAQPPAAPEPPFQHGYLQEVRHVPIVGVDPADAAAWQRQSDEVGCAIAAERGILETFGVHASEEELRNLAVANGWHDPETGTYADDVGRLLEASGVPVERGYEHTLTDLYDALHQNAKVLVGLDSSEIWHPVHGHGGAPLEQPDHPHIVWVTGMEIDDAGGMRVILNDSGTPDGKEMAVDATDFLNAWADFGNFAVIAHRT
ncbi:MAG: hypothetical protein ACJ76N_31455 [Thermoanaerobaculia bacterium]